MNQNNKYCHSEQTLSCHPELVSGSICGSAWRVGNTLNGSGQRDNGFRTKSGMTGESGRSMVEMLGVLAIIGVLSVGGISGYTTAMNKHKANEILNAAAVRAMAVSSQLQSGAETPTLGEFDSNENIGGATFTGVSTSGDKFTIGFSMDNNAVLDQIKNIAGTDGIVRAITSGGLVYNDDLSTGERASDFDGKGTGEGGCDTSKYTYCSESGRCLEGTSADCCVGQNAQCCNSSTGAITTGSSCDFEGSGDGICNDNGTCEAAPDPSTYTTPESCDNAGFEWCTYNQTCRENTCSNPRNFSQGGFADDEINKEACESEGYIYYIYGPGSGANALHACSTYELKEGEYKCWDGKSWYFVESEEYCPRYRYTTKTACESAGLRWFNDCNSCQLSDGHDPC